MNEAVGISDSRPIVRSRQNAGGLWAFAVVAAVGAGLLYSSLESARSDRLTSNDGSSSVDVAPARALPELAIPQLTNSESAVNPDYEGRPAIRLVATPSPSALPPTVVYRSPPVSRLATPSPVTPSYNYAPPPPVLAPQVEPLDPAKTAGRSFAQKLANPSYTVVQGSLIPAVMETALDSTHAGPARAMVSRDVLSFDRQRVLIPRGSKLVGEYQSDFSAGQNRASVTWTRLIRPDGGTIELKSSSADGLGRAGIRGKVNNHTMQRIGDALLQTMVGIGTGLTQRAATQPIIVVPGGAQPPSINLNSGRNIQPTLTVPQGTRVSVFVGRDLDFSDVDQAQ